MDVTSITLTNGTGSVELGNNFTLRNGDCASGNEDIASIAIQNSNQDFLTLTFLKTVDRAVSMSLMFTVSPGDYFAGVKTTSKHQH